MTNPNGGQPPDKKGKDEPFLDDDQLIDETYLIGLDSYDDNEKWIVELG